MGQSTSSNYRQEIKFLISFVVIYAFLQWIYFQVPWQILRDVIYYFGIVNVAAEILNPFTQELVVAAQNKLSSTKAILEIVRGCDGSGSMFLLSAAILAFSCGFKHKLGGLIAGLVLLYMINMIRIVGLYFIVAYRGEWFLPGHTYFAPTLVILCSALFFIWWARRASLVAVNN